MPPEPIDKSPPIITIRYFMNNVWLKEDLVDKYQTSISKLIFLTDKPENLINNKN